MKGLFPVRDPGARACRERRADVRTVRIRANSLRKPLQGSDSVMSAASRDDHVPLMLVSTSDDQTVEMALWDTAGA